MAARFSNICRNTPHALRFWVTLVIAFLLASFPITHALAQEAASEKQASTAGVIFEGRVIGDDQSMRVVLQIDRETEYSVFYMEQPRRLVIDFPNTKFAISDEKPLKARGLASDVRYGAMSKSRSRMVISLKSPARVAAIEQEKTEQGRYQLALDLQPVDEAEFAKLLAQSALDGSRSNKVATKGDKPGRVRASDGHFIIVIDPGHGGIDGGASDRKGALEKRITLEFAHELEAALKNAGPYEIFLTRRDDHFVSLRQRLEFTISKQADLFISVHADSLRQKHVRGATIYTLSNKASDAISRNLAQSENAVDLLAGLEKEKVSSAVLDILADLTARETKIFSRRFAKMLVVRLGERIKLIKNPHRQAAFGVLKDPQVPSILIELGYLSNVKDAALLISGEWRKKVADGIVGAVGSFFDGRKPRQRADSASQQ